MQAQSTLGLFVACIILPLATAVGPNGLVQPGAPADCISWYTAKDGDTVTGIARTNNIPLVAFMDANPQLSGNPLALWAGFDYCVPQGSRTPPTPGIGTDSPGKGPSNPEETGYSNKGSSLTFQGATGTGGPMQPANGTGYFPVSSTGADKSVPPAPTSASGEEAAKPAPTSTTGASTNGPPAADSSNGGKSTSNDTAEKSSGVKGSSTVSEASTADAQPTAAPQSGESSQSPTGSQSSTGFQSSAVSQSTESPQSTAGSQSDTGAQSSTGSQTTTDSQSRKSSQSTAASPGSSGSNSGGSTMTTSILAPTQKQSAQTETQNSGGNGASDLATSFGAARRDLKETKYAIVYEIHSSAGKEWTETKTETVETMGPLDAKSDEELKSKLIEELKSRKSLKEAETIEPRAKFEVIEITEIPGEGYGIAEVTQHGAGSTWTTTITAAFQ